MSTIRRYTLLSAMILSLWLTPTQEQTGCVDVSGVCKLLGNRDFCTSHQEVMFERCPQTCGVCGQGSTGVIFPRDSIANPEFVCGVFNGDSSLSRKRRQFGGGLEEVFGAVGAHLPNLGRNPISAVPNPFPPRNRPSVPGNQVVTNTAFPVYPSFIPVELSKNPFNPTFPFESNRAIVQVDKKTINRSGTTVTVYETVTIFATATAIATALPAPLPTPVGGGTTADTPSVGVVFIVDTAPPSRPTGIVRPTPVTINSPITRPINVPNPTLITSRPDPGEGTTDVIPLSSGGVNLKDAICGSAPITDRFLLSAAHCFSDISKRYRVRLGDLDISQPGETNSQPQDVDIEKIFIHPEYKHSSGVRYNDIALLQTAQKIKFSPLVFPYCVLSQPKDFSGAPLTVSGFGLVNATHRSPALQSAVLGGLNDVRCQVRYSELGYDQALRMRYPDLLVGKGILCATAHGRSACQGDSGGPLTIRDVYGRNYLVGIVSIGASCLGNSLPILPGLYTDVAHHVQWIDSIIYTP